MKSRRILIAAFCVLCAGLVALIILASPEPSPQALVAKARLDASAGKLHKAEPNLRKAIGLRPDHAPTHLELSHVLLRQQDTHQALTSYHNALALDPLLILSDEFARYVASVYSIEKRRRILRPLVQQVRSRPSQSLRFEPVAVLDLAGHVKLRGRALAIEEAERGLKLLAGHRAGAAARYLSHGKLDAAIDIVEGLADTGEEANTIVEQLTRARAHQQAARVLFEEAVGTNGNSTASWLALANMDIQAGAVAEGTQAVLKVVGRLEDPPVELLIYAARLAMQHGILRDAETLVRKALEKDPDNSHALYMLAAMLFLQGEFEQLAPVIDSLRRNNPRDPRVMFLEGSIDLIEGRFRRATERLAAAGAGHTRWKLLPYHLGLAHYRIGAIGRAQQCMQALYNHPGVFPEARIARAAIALTRERLDIAEESCRAVLARSPDDPEALRLLAAVHIGRRDVGPATETLSRYVSVRPESALGAQALAAARMANGDLEAVIAEHEARLKRSAAPKVHHNILALAYGLAGRPKQAESHYEKASAGDASLPHVWLLRARALALEGRVLAAADECRRALAHGASPAAMLTARGVFNTILGHYGEAREELAVGTDPYAADTFTIDVYFALARHENYEDAATEILTVDPFSRSSQDLLIAACSAGLSGETLKESLNAIVSGQPGVLGVLNKAVIMRRREAATAGSLKLINVDSMWARLVGAYRHHLLEWR